MVNNILNRALSEAEALLELLCLFLEALEDAGHTCILLCLLLHTNKHLLWHAETGQHYYQLSVKVPLACCSASHDIHAQILRLELHLAASQLHFQTFKLWVEH